MPPDPPLDRLDATAVFGGSFNPPGLHHRRLAECLLERFGRVLVVPCGFRMDKAGSADWLSPERRRGLINATFADLAAAGLAFDWSDLDKPFFTPTFELARRYRSGGELWFVAGADLFAGGGSGLSQIQTGWREGQRIWTELNWVCLTRPGIEIKHDDLPPRHLLLEADITGSSSEIRRRLDGGQTVDGLVVPEVARMLADQA
jgi:nicotinic acid mononucleotide adenylyltransferase